MPTSLEFAFKEGPDLFSPQDLVELARPGTGVANLAGDLVLVPVSKYSFADKKNHKFIYLAPLEPTVRPLEISLAKGGTSFWINSRTVAQAVENEDEKTMELYALSINFEKGGSSAGTLTTPDPPVLIGKLPTSSASNFRYSANHLVFSDYVYPDGNISAIKEGDKAYEDRGNTALVYDSTYVRHWDTWVGPKRSSIFTVELVQDADNKWSLGSEFVNVLKGTSHSTPVEPFGGSDDFDVSDKRIVYTSKDPLLPEAMHTKQNIYIADLEGSEGPKELTSGSQGATHNPVLNSRGDKVAWLELDKDGAEADRAKIVIYDLERDVRFTLTQEWDRSPDSLAFSKEGEFLYFTAGDEAKVKVFVIPVPPTPEQSTTHPVLPHKYRPSMLTDSRAASGIQTLANGDLIFTQSSFTSPNDIFVIHGLAQLEDSVDRENGPFKGQVEQITHFTQEALEGKNLSEAEEFWFKGAENKDVHGWVLKPKGWKAGEKKKWPILLLIHGGPQGAWEDQWSTRWNPNIFAQQGYFTVAINPTGSSTFGQEFIDAITEDWGGKPFEDLQKGWKYVLNAYPEIDGERAFAAGASWGGYAINWIQGHPEYGFGFKALVCHDGVFDSNYNGYSTDELFFFNHDWGGRPWENKSKTLSDKYSPVNYVHKWSTPQLLIHGSKDYRLPETEGIGAFHALQQRGIRSRLVIFPDENHWVLNHGNSLKWHYEVLRWFDEFVGDS
jgi:dipeptidyl aminopeptidase/acylaminoacyl peptidase